ncbi:unnamed protein product [Phytophthora fragariaefolia]|uniref:Unnamed protein product n=1 Tax=Phytophthora fragariaefolia TaxID=1490495 RepID=A0A9W6YGP1_9STRA|nr:unnamed protein product [Phytophthora fragariaefolia]
MDSDDEALELAAQVRALRTQLRARDEETLALQDQVAAVTTQLRETSDVLECRMSFVADAMTQIESLQAQVAEAKRALLTREMQLHDGAQREKELEAALHGKEQQCDHWEGEFHRVDRELTAQKAAQRELKQELQAKADDVRAWKTKCRAAVTSADELKLQNTTFRKKERELVATLRRHVEAAESNQSSWKARLAKREQTIEALRKQCQYCQGELERLDQERVREKEEREQDKIDISEQQLDKQKHLVELREKVAKLTAVVEKAQVKEQLFRREIFRLREELLQSESHRETEHRRQRQLLEGKEKEVAFIWQKYVEVMPLAEGDRSY